MDRCFTLEGYELISQFVSTIFCAVKPWSLHKRYALDDFLGFKMWTFKRFIQGLATYRNLSRISVSKIKREIPFFSFFAPNLQKATEINANVRNNDKIAKKGQHFCHVFNIYCVSSRYSLDATVNKYKVKVCRQEISCRQTRRWFFLDTVKEKRTRNCFSN